MNEIPIVNEARHRQRPSRAARAFAIAVVVFAAVGFIGTIIVVTALVINAF